MNLEIGQLKKANVTRITLVWLFTRMRFLVPFQIRLIGTTFITEITFKGLFPGMTFCMETQFKFKMES